MAPAYKAIPNILTSLRLAAGIVMFLLLAGATSGFPFVSAWLSPDDQFAMYRTGFWIFVIAASTDWIDGYLARRWKAETAGVTVNGTSIDTGRDSQALITGAAVSAMLDPGYSVRWKTPAGFIDLEGQQIIDMATAVRAHVQAAFDREAELLEALADSTFTEVMLEEGWPGESAPAPAAG